MLGGPGWTKPVDRPIQRTMGYSGARDVHEPCFIVGCAGMLCARHLMTVLIAPARRSTAPTWSFLSECTLAHQQKE